MSESVVADTILGISEKGYPTSSSEAFLFTGGKKEQYTCNSCMRNITTEFRIRCAECTDYDICADCFAAGHERENHKRTHAYRIVDSLDSPLFTKDWTINEELMLLEGIEKYGAGNWKTIADYLGTGKTANTLEAHYWELYMGHHGQCLPRTAQVDTIASSSGSGSGSSSSSSERTTVPIEQASTKAASQSSIPTVEGYNRLTAQAWSYQCNEVVLRDGGVKSVVLTGKAKANVDSEIRDRISALPGADLAGFIPLREVSISLHVPLPPCLPVSTVFYFCLCPPCLNVSFLRSLRLSH